MALWWISGISRPARTPGDWTAEAPAATFNFTGTPTRMITQGHLELPRQQ